MKSKLIEPLVYHTKEVETFRLGSIVVSDVNGSEDNVLESKRCSNNIHYLQELKHI